MANKHEIKGYIYVTSEEKPIYGNYVSNGKHICIYEEQSLILIRHWRKIILCNNPNLSIQQLSTEEVEYLKSVDSFEVLPLLSNNQIALYGYKILIPQETEQPKESIEVKTNERFLDFSKYDTTQTLYTEDEVLELLLKHQSDYRSSVRKKSPIDWSFNIVEWFNKHKKQ